MSKFWIVTKEVYRKNVKSGTFIFMVLMPFIFAAIGLAVSVFMGHVNVEKGQGHIGLVGDITKEEAVFKKENPKFTFDIYSDSKEAENALKDDHIDGYLEASIDPATQDKDQFVKKTTSKDIQMTGLQSALDHIRFTEKVKDIGITDEQARMLTENSSKIQTNYYSDKNQGEVDTGQSERILIKQGVSLALSIILFFFMMMYISIISQEVATEKGSRIMEIILSSISAKTHFYGKMCGIGLMLLTQAGIYALVGIIGLIYLNNSGLAILSNPHFNEVIGIIKDMLPISGGFVILGIFMYTSIAGYLGSLVSKIEDVGKVISPLTIIAVFGYYIAIFAMQGTNNNLVKFASQFPLWSPFIMPIRYAAETVSMSAYWISVVVAIITSIVITMLAASLYQSTVLIYNDKGVMASLKQSLQLWYREKKAEK